MLFHQFQSDLNSQQCPDADADATPTSGKETGNKASGKDAAVSLPPHLVDGGILWYLSALESARFAGVCKPWARIVSRRLSNPAPHLFAFRPTTTHRRGEVIAVPLGGCRHVGAARHAGSRALQRVTRRTECVGATASGRLVLANSRRTVLFNPVTGAFRRIKKVPGLSYDYYTAKPMPVVPLGGDSFFHGSGSGSGEVGVWRAEDGRWTVGHVDHAEPLRMAVLCGDSVFALDAMGCVVKIELPSFQATELDVPSLRDEYQTALDGAVDKGYLVEAGGEVLFVWPLFTTSRVRGKRELFEFDDSGDEDGEDDDEYFFDDVRRLSGFEVYRLDMEEMRWVKEDRLAGDDVAVFVSRWSSFSVRASDKGCVSNCVYFVCDEGVGDTWGAFSLGERTMLFEHAIGAASYRERLWFYPNPKEPGLEEMNRRLDEIGYI